MTARSIFATRYGTGSRSALCACTATNAGTAKIRRTQRSGLSCHGRDARRTEPRPSLPRSPSEDRLIALEFKTELDEDEQRVFGWLVEGLQYRADRVGAGHPGQRGAQYRPLVRAKARALPAALRHGPPLRVSRHRRSMRCRTGRRPAKSSPSARSRTLRVARTAGWSTRRTPSGCGAASATRPRPCSRRCSSAISAGYRDSACERGFCCTASGPTRRRSGRAACANAPSLCSRAAASARRSPSGVVTRWRARRRSSRHARPRAEPRTAPPPRRAERSSGARAQRRSPGGF